MVNHGLDFHRRLCQSQLLKLKLAITKLFIMTNVVISDCYIEHHVVESRNVFERERLAIHRVQIVLFMGGFPLAKALVPSQIVLFKVEYDVWVAFSWNKQIKIRVVSFGDETTFVRRNERFFFSLRATQRKTYRICPRLSSSPLCQGKR